MDDDTPKQSAQTTELQPIAIFYQALTSAHIECDQLAHAIGQQDWENAKIAAEDAVASFLVAKAALRRLEPCSTEPGDAVRVANIGLFVARRVLGGVFERAMQQRSAQPLHPLLRQLMVSLAIASGEPSPDDPSDTGSQ